jgi:hypothetical protein
MPVYPGALLFADQQDTIRKQYAVSSDLLASRVLAYAREMGLNNSHLNRNENCKRDFHSDRGELHRTLHRAG